ncbi:taste receptor type 1 member 3-like [Carcharodon carcharias]|uniref:taste receptor type 1 member 3-like n=1 Tax=Carcharodon carcharias TaxID=13397 RepID=UPI001B7EEF6B|nr:taste receptor type 1 member 3-like [Carcharodon carcharias]
MAVVESKGLFKHINSSTRLFFYLVVSKDSVTETQRLHGIDALYTLPGDYTIGALFPFHMIPVGLTHRSKPEEVTCDSFYSVGYGMFLAMTFTIDEINNSTSLLPDVQLGYEVYDDCYETMVSLLPSLLFLSKNKSNGIDVLCNYTKYRNRVIALLGPWTSEQVIATAKLFSLFLVPHISYGASSEELSNKKLYPSFLRTMPSDRNQAMAIVSIVKEFNWNWIAGIGSDDEYGRQGMELVQEFALLQGICIGYIEMIPIYRGLASTKQKISEIVGRIRQMNVNVIILFSSEGPAHELLKQVVKVNITRKVWIGSEAWVKAAIVIYTPDIERIGTVIGTVINSGSMPGFESYVLNHLTNIRDTRERSLSAQHSGNQSFPFWPYPSESSDQLLSAIQQLGPNNMSVVLDQPVRRSTFSVYTAVYSIAHAIHALLKCHNGRCQNTARWYNWQLLEELKQVNFTINNTTIHYDAAGNPQRGYDIITWIQHAGQLKLPVIGNYKDHLTIHTSQIQWKTVDKTVPPSYCSKSCGLGQKKIAISLYSCCFECEDCPGGTFQDLTDGFSCNDCQSDEWSPPNNTFCFKKTLQYLSWVSPVGVAMLLIMVLNLALILAVMVVFLLNSSTPIVEGTGGKMNMVILTSLALLGCSTLLYLGEPSELTCKSRLPVTAFSLTICISTLLVNSMQILLSTELTGLTKSLLHKCKCIGWYIIISVSLGGQGAICYFWLNTDGDFLIKTTGNSEDALVLFCKSDSEVMFWLMLGYSGLLALVCFMCTFLIQTPAQTYNLAREITVSMLFYTTIWLCFVPIHPAVSKKHAPIIQISASLLSSFAILSAYFIPKCFVIWFKPQYNTPEYFQIYGLQILTRKECQ